MRVRTVQLPSSVPKSMSKVSPGATFSSSQFWLQDPASRVLNVVTEAEDLLTSSNFQLLARARGGTAKASASAQAPSAKRG
jgi:hypothetical protein